MSHLFELSRSRRPTTHRHNFITLLSVVLSDGVTTFRQRTMTQLFMHRRRLHRHTGVRRYVLLQKLGVPYEVERTVCSECQRVLDERPLKRAAT
jgi:NMD protein affecting ribosome stability and mRNA decay